MDVMVRVDHQLVGKTFYAFVLPNGKVRELEGAQQIIAQAFREAKLTKDDVNTENQLRQKLTPEYFTELVEMAFHNLPEQPVALNESWNFTVERATSLSFIADYRYALTSIQNNTASMIVQGDFRPHQSATGVQLSNGMLARYALRGRENGSADVDATTGWLKSKNLSQNLNGSLLYSGGALGSAEVPLIVEMTTVVEPAF
jgi:hypothetical protein